MTTGGVLSHDSCTATGGSSPQGLAISSTGVLAFDPYESLFLFTTNTATGALRPVSGSPIALGGDTYGVGPLAFSPNGALAPGLASCADSGGATSGAGSLQATITDTVKPAPPSDKFSVSKPKLGKRGSLSFTVTLPGAGTLTLTETAKSGKKPATKTLKISKAGAQKLSLAPTHPGKTTSFTLKVVFTPAGGTSRTVTLTGLHQSRK
jgi:hypothetical protein